MEKRPELSIVTSLFNALAHTRRLVETLPGSLPPGMEVEIILVNDGSTDGTSEYLRELGPPFVVVDRRDNEGFAFRNNEGAKQARGDRLLFLNNDVEVAAGWLEPMLALADQPPRGRRVGCIGNLQVNPGTEVLNHAGVYFDPLDQLPRHALDGWVRAPRARWWDWHAVTAACLLIRKDLFFQFHGFDEGFRNGFEDVDLCLRLVREGYVHLTANHSRIGHYGGSSPGRYAVEDANIRRFREKWKSWLPGLARRDYGRILRRTWDGATKRRHWRLWLVAEALRFLPEGELREEPYAAWERLMHNRDLPGRG